MLKLREQDKCCQNVRKMLHSAKQDNMREDVTSEDRVIGSLGKNVKRFAHLPERKRFGAPGAFLYFFRGFVLDLFAAIVC